MSNNNFTQTNVFSCPIYKIRIDPSSYDKEEIINDIKYNKSLKNTRNNPHQRIGRCLSDTHHSYRDYDNETFRDINYDKLMPVYREVFENFIGNKLHKVKKINLTFQIVNYSAMTEGQYLPFHNHIQSADFATVHYLNFKNGHIGTMFESPIIFSKFLNNLRPEMYSILDLSSSDNSYLWEFFQMETKEDDMFIFPSALNHEVGVQEQTKEPRITISTNIQLRLQSLEI